MQPTEASRIFQVEIRTRNLKRAVEFYQAVFDWKIQVVSMDYAMVDTGAAPLVALWQIPHIEFPVGVCNYIRVPDCAQAAARVQQLGGRICISQTQLPGSGSFVGTLDPWGNEVFFWQSSSPGEPQFSGSARNVMWLLEIPTTDINLAADYYRALLGWTFLTIVENKDVAFTYQGGLGRGISLLSGEVGSQVRGTTNYVTCSDLAALATRITEAGGRVVRGPVSGIGGEGSFLIFRDRDENRMGAFQPV